MARDGSGVYFLPAGSAAVTGTTISSTKYNGVINDLEADANVARPIVAGGTGATTVGAARSNLGIPATVESKSTAYTAVAGDRSKLIRGTATLTLSLTAAATLGDGWYLDVVADGGDVTIDPDGSETINGSATLTVEDGKAARVHCDGTGFYTTANAAVTLAANTVWANLTGSAAAPASYTMTQLATAMGFSQSLTTPYQQELPGGIMMQAGTNTTGATGTTVTFPTAFSSTPIVLVAGVATVGAIITIRNQTATNFVAEGWTTSGVEVDRSFTWMAMGSA